MRVLLVRHGQSEWNASRKLQGQADIGLSEKGKAQADSLRSTIESIGYDLAISSDLSRAHETATRIGATDAKLEPRLRENDVGDWTGRTIADIQATEMENYLGWRAGTATPPNGETWHDFAERTRSVIDEVQGKSCKNLLLVCHGGVVRAILQSYLSLMPSSIIPVGPGSMTSLRLADDQSKPPRLELFNYRPDTLEFEAPD